MIPQNRKPVASHGGATVAHRSDPTIRRVAFVITELRAGGAERVIVHLASTLPSLGVEPTVVCLTRKGPLAVEIEAHGVPVISVKSLRGYDFGAIAYLAKLFRRLRADVINVHDRSSLPYVVLANRLAGRRPIVFTCHGLLLGVSSRRIQRLAMWDVKAVTAVSEQTAEAYARLLAWPERIEIVPNGVPDLPSDAAMRRSVRGELGLADGTFVFLAVGNVKPEKGFEDLIEAAAALRGGAPHRPFAVLIAGGVVDEAYDRRLHAQASDLGLKRQVRFLGFRQDIQSLYSAADAFVLPSRTEGLPMALLEAMSSGLPAVATRVGGVPKVVADGRDVLLVQPQAPEHMARAMSRLMDDDALRARIAGEARSLVRREYSVQRMSSEYLRAFREVAGEAHNRVVAVKPRVLMLGPLPPLTGGMATVTDNLRTSSLAEKCRLVVLNNGKTTSEGRSLWAGVQAQALLFLRLLRAIRRHRAQIVHIHTIQFFGFWRDCVHLAAARLLGCRVFLHNHGASFDQWAAQMGPLARGVLRWSFEAATGVIVLTGGWLERLMPYAPRAHWHVVPNGVSVPPCPNDVMKGRPVFLFLGDWTRRKGVHDLVAATELASRRGFDGFLHLAGFEKEPGQLAALRKRIAMGACASRIRILGKLSITEKDKALAASHCLVLPSYAEGLPVAILEAMGHGLPIIATRVGAIEEAVADGQEGFLIDPGDVAALADRMCRLDADRDLMQRMGSAARHRVASEYALDRSVQRLLQLYRLHSAPARSGGLCRHNSSSRGATTPIPEGGRKRC